MRVTRLTPPTFEPVSLADAKAYCRVKHSLEDSLFNSLIGTARFLCEVYAKAAFCHQSFRVIYRWPYRDSILGVRRRLEDPDNVAHGFTVPFGPLINLVSIELLSQETGEVSTLVLDTDYEIVLGNRIVFLSDLKMDQTFTHLVVQFEAGWPSADVPQGDPVVAECPEVYKQCVLEQVAFMYQNRGDEKTNVSPKVKAMLAGVVSSGLPGETS